MKWLVLIPAMGWFAYYAFRLEQFPGFVVGAGALTFIMLLFSMLYALSWTSLITFFTESSMFAGGRVWSAASGDGEGFIAWLLRLGLLGLVYFIPLRIFLG